MLTSLTLLALGIFGPGIATGLVSGPQLGAGAMAGAALGAPALPLPWALRRASAVQSPPGRAWHPQPRWPAAERDAATGATSARSAFQADLHPLAVASRALPPVWQCRQTGAQAAGRR